MNWSAINAIVTNGAETDVRRLYTTAQAQTARTHHIAGTAIVGIDEQISASRRTTTRFSAIGAYGFARVNADSGFAMAFCATLIAATATIKRVSLKVAAARITTGVCECAGTTCSWADGKSFKTIGEDFCTITG